MLGDMPETVGYEVVLVGEAAGALRIAQHGLTQEFILDFGLSDIDGDELARRLRAKPCISGATIISLTGLQPTAGPRPSEGRRFDYHFVEPADHDEQLRILSGLTANQATVTVRQRSNCWAQAVLEARAACRVPDPLRKGTSWVTGYRLAFLCELQTASRRLLPIREIEGVVRFGPG